MTGGPGNPMLVAALEAAGRGWLVLPLHGIHAGTCTCGDPRCGRPGKHPRIKTGKKHSAASTDPNQIRVWWKRWPSANVGVATGACSGVIVVDADAGKGGLGSLDTFEREHGPLQETYRVRTGGGGLHLFFQHPGGTVRNRVGVMPGIDVRSDGGFVVAVGSTHVSGGRYQVERDGDLAELPDTLRALLCMPPKATKVTSAPRVTAPRWAEKALQAECKRVATAPEGERNDTLNRAAFSLGQIVGGRGLDREQVERELLKSAEACGLSGGEAERTIRSGLEDGVGQPRGPRLGLAPPGARVRDVAGEWDPADSPTGPQNATDLGNAERLAAHHSEGLRFCHDWKTWVVWDQKRWTVDRDGKAVRLAKETVREIYHEVAATADEEKRRALALHARGSEAHRRIVAMLELAKYEEAIKTTSDDFDGAGTRYLLNVLNGTIDLRTGGLRPHRREDMITRLASVTFDPQASCPTFDAFIGRIQRDPELRGYLQRWMGYTLTADTREQKFALLYGPGANGKTTLIETYKALLGDYGYKAEFSTFLEARRENHQKGAPRPDILALRGPRLIAAVEAGAGRRLDMTTIKELTGGDTITARQLYQGQTSFRLEGKLWLAANHRPELPEATEAAWRRVVLIPFSETIPERERDKTLPDRLRAPEEQSGILAWAVRGALAWQREGLEAPEAVRRETASYREAENVIGPFLEARCECDCAGWASFKDLRSAYENWCNDAGEPALGPKQFAQALEEQQGIERRKGEKRARGYAGVRVLDMFSTVTRG